MLKPKFSRGGLVKKRTLIRSANLSLTLSSRRPCSNHIAPPHGLPATALSKTPKALSTK